MSASPDWAPSQPLREAVEQAVRFWKVHHPNRRVPADHDHAAEFREYCRALSQVHLGSVMDVAEAVLDSTSGHWPRPLEVRKCARAFALRAEERANGWPERIDSVLYDDTRNVDAQCDAILRGVGLDGPDVGSKAKSEAITAVMGAVTHAVYKAVDAGTLPKSKLAELRAGTYPTPAQLEKRARDLAEKARSIAPRQRFIPALPDTVRAIHQNEAA
jgi:hypothetical protein